MNGLHFDQRHLMLKNEHQNITGVKLFSSSSKLNITKLVVAKNLNNISINAFYCEQVHKFIQTNSNINITYTEMARKQNKIKNKNKKTLEI